MTGRESGDPYYDLFDDWDLIVASFLSQYGLRIRTKEFESVSWDEFRSLISGLSPDTVLGLSLIHIFSDRHDVAERRDVDLLPFVFYDQ